MHEQTLPGTTAGTLALLSEKNCLPENTYLAGGTAAALQLGHRVSWDLDFFTPIPFEERVLQQHLEQIGMKPKHSAWRTVLGTFNEIDFSCFFYEYPLLCTTHTFNGIAICDLQDIAAMKIDAIATRGVQRDFVDLYCIMQEHNFSLTKVLNLYQEKFNTDDDKLIHIIKSLTYFAEAEGQQARPLEMLIDLDWKDVRTFFEEAVQREGRMLLSE